VVNSENKLENLSEEIKELNPCRWKVFQCLLIDGENFGEGALRDARSMVVSDEEFNTFVRNH
jgi:radical S-adenosyl methionine domain-containing protein 2